MSTGHSNALFLEQYLDRPIEEFLRKRTNLFVDRKEIVEIGNLASSHRGFFGTLEALINPVKSAIIPTLFTAAL